MSKFFHVENDYMVNGVTGVRLPPFSESRFGFKPLMQNSNINSNADNTKPGILILKIIR